MTDFRAPARQTRARRAGFTLLEVMLASMLGLIVVIAAMGLFTTLSTSDRQSNESYHRQMELSLAHQTVERSLRILVMDNTAYPRPAAGAQGASSGNSSGKRDGSRALTEADGSAAAETPAQASKRPRLLLEPDTRLPPAMRFEDEKGVVTYITPQRLEVTLTRPPVFAPPTAQELMEAELDARADHVAMNQTRRSRPSESGNRSGSRSGSRRGTDASGSSTTGSRTGRAASAQSRPSNDQLTEMARRAGVSADELAAATSATGSTNPADQASAGDEEASEVALSPGLRGVFEIRWDPERTSTVRQTSLRPGASTIDQTQGSWSLWWRPVPEAEILMRNAGEAVPDYLAASDLLLPDGSPATDLARGSVMLASNLETCRWEMVRSGETTDTFSATWQDELPAYTTLEMRTKSGLWMKWMFEVDWTRGGEPGEPVSAGNAPLTTPGNINQLNPGNRNGINNGNNGNKGPTRGTNGASFLGNRSGGK